LGVGTHRDRHPAPGDGRARCGVPITPPRHRGPAYPITSPDHHGLATGLTTSPSPGAPITPPRHRDPAYRPSQGHRGPRTDHANVAGVRRTDHTTTVRHADSYRV